MFSGVAIASSGWIPKTVDPTQISEIHQFMEMGGHYVRDDEEWERLSYLIVKSDARTHKVKKALRQGIPVLNHCWLLLSLRWRCALMPAGFTYTGDKSSVKAIADHALRENIATD